MLSRRLLILGLALATSLAGAFYAKRAQTEKPVPSPTLAVPPGPAASAVAPLKARDVNAFVDLSMTKALPRSYPRPTSDWQSSEKAFYQKKLSSGQFDVLVVPFQISGWGVDRSTRSLMTAELAVAIAQSKNLKVADPYLVAKALGDGHRQLQAADIYRLADAAGAKRIIWGYVGHDRAEKLSVAIQTQDHSGTVSAGGAWGAIQATRTFANIPMPKDSPAIEAYESVLPEILKALAPEDSAGIPVGEGHQLTMSTLPASPLNLVSAEENAAQDAYAYHVYAALTPRYIERTKEIFVEKAHLALLRLPRTVPEYRALRARTYMAMGLRPAALKVLDNPQTDEERELVAALNGNLPEVRALSSREKSPLKRLLQKLDEHNIATAYGLKNSQQAIDDLANLKLPGPIWKFLVTRAVLEFDAWSQFDSPPL